VYGLWTREKIANEKLQLTEVVLESERVGGRRRRRQCRSTYSWWLASGIYPLTTYPCAFPCKIKKNGCQNCLVIAPRRPSWKMKIAKNRWQPPFAGVQRVYIDLQNASAPFRYLTKIYAANKGQAIRWEGPACTSEDH